MSGTRLLLTLALEMRRRGAIHGVAAACIGGGQGIAALVQAPGEMHEGTMHDAKGQRSLQSCCTRDARPKVTHRPFAFGGLCVVAWSPSSPWPLAR